MSEPRTLATVGAEVWMRTTLLRWTLNRRGCWGIRGKKSPGGPRMNELKIPKLDPREEHFRIPSHHAGRSLFLRCLAPPRAAQIRGNVVLYVHGGTFPSGLSVAHRFDGRSWRD